MKKEPSKVLKNPISKKESKKPLIYRILNDEHILGTIRELAESGASLSTIDAMLGLPPGKMSYLLNKGKESPRSPHRRFYIMFRKWAAVARMQAEGKMLEKNPEKWLDRNTSARAIETQEDVHAAVDASARSQAYVPTANIEKVLGALRLLRQANISIDKAIDTDSLEVAPEDGDENQ